MRISRSICIRHSNLRYPSSKGRNLFFRLRSRQNQVPTQIQSLDQLAMHTTQYLLLLSSLRNLIISHPTAQHARRLPRYPFRPPFPFSLSGLAFRPPFPVSLSVLPFRSPFPSSLSVLPFPYPFHYLFSFSLPVLPFRDPFPLSQCHWIVEDWEQWRVLGVRRLGLGRE